MKRILSALLLFALLTAPGVLPAEASESARGFFDNLFGRGAKRTVADETPTPAPTLDAEFLFGDLFSDRTEQPEPNPEPNPEPSPEPSPELSPAPTLDVEFLFGDLFSDRTEQPEPNPEPSPELSPAPTLDAEFLFGDLFSDRTEQPEPSPAPTLEPEPTPGPADGIASGALFDEGVRWITSSAWGGKVDFAQVGGWTVNRGYFDGRYCLTGISPEGERVVLSDSDPMSFVPAGDAIAYFGEGTKGDYGWMLLVPGERMPQKLPLDAASEVFYADGEAIWYYTPGGESERVGRLDRERLKKKKVGAVKGRVVAMMPGGEVLVANFAKNRVQLWKNGKYQTIYDPKEAILSVVTTGRSVWIEHEDGYGPLADGEVPFRLPGRIVRTAGSSDQFALLVLPYEGADFFDIYLFNEIYRAYAGVGRVKRSDSTFIEFQQDRMIAWGPEESVEFEYPIPELWLPYGHYDFASAENFLSDEGWAQLLIGSWCAEPLVGAGYAERLIFTEEALYRLPPQQGKKRAKARKSQWLVSGRLLMDYADEDTPELLWLAGPFSVPPEEGPHSPRIAIGAKVYYQYADDPAYFEDLKDYGIRVESSARSPKADGWAEAP